MRLFFLSFITTLIIVGCTSFSKHGHHSSLELLPPDLNLSTSRQVDDQINHLEQISQSRRHTNIQWWTSYHQARLLAEIKPQAACEHWSRLSQDNLFPLHDLALLRAYQVCEDSSSLTEIEYPANLPLWLKSVYVEAELSRSTKNKDWLKVMELNFEKSKANLPQSQKLEFMQKALAIAKDLGREKEITLYQERIYTLAPRFLPKPKPADFLKVAHDHRLNRDFTQAEYYYRKIISGSQFSYEEKTSAYRGLSLSYRNQRNRETYLKAEENHYNFVLKNFRQNPKSNFHQKAYHDRATAFMRALWTQNHVTRARNLLADIVKELQGKYTLSEVYWLYGRMDEERQEFTKAINWFTKAVAETPETDSEQREKVLWYKAWNLRKIKQWKDAAEAFKALKEETQNEFSRARFTFWLAKTLSDQGLIKESQEAYHELIEMDPMGYYGLLAHYQLDKKIPPFSITQAKLNPPKHSALENFDPLYTDWLIALNETEVANTYLSLASQTLTQNPSESLQNQAVWTYLLKYYAKAGSYLELFEQLGHIPADQRNQILSQHPELIFPRPFYPIVREAAKQHNVSLELIYSIMRQESAFNPQARSPADAFGLMQLLPEVAAKTAQSLGIEYNSPEDLYLPEINIPLGAAFINQLWKRHQGKFIPAAAAYNASEQAFNGWMQTRYQGNTLEFIEDIPYQETRGYIRLVLRNLIFYQLIEANGKSIPFPAWTLSL